MSDIGIAGGPFSVSVFTPEEAATITNFDRLPAAKQIAAHLSVKSPKSLVMVRNSAGELKCKYRAGERVAA